MIVRSLLLGALRSVWRSVLFHSFHVALRVPSCFDGQLVQLIQTSGLQAKIGHAVVTFANPLLPSQPYAAQLSKFCSSKKSLNQKLQPPTTSGSFPKKTGLQNRPQKTIILSIGTPQKSSTNFGKPLNPKP